MLAIGNNRLRLGFGIAIGDVWTWGTDGTHIVNVGGRCGCVVTPSNTETPDGKWRAQVRALLGGLSCACTFHIEASMCFRNSFT